MPHCHTYLEKLRESGYRITPQREIIIQIIAHIGRHMTAEEIYEQLREKSASINIATVYRTLELLVENGLASRSDLGEANTAYATGEHGAHIHLVCRHCGSVTEVNDADIDSLLVRISEKHDFDCRPGHFAINGICEKCREDL